jgi:FtsP/CotA-like multicopper oxidase with cupredoxin domain
VKGRTLPLWAAAALVLLQPGFSPPSQRSDQILPNDNQVSAGRMRGDTLTLDLEVRMGIWRPEADTGPAIEVAAFAERGKALQIPGPLIRVKTGTVIVARITNALSDSTISIHGLITRPAAAWDSVVLRPGESKEIRFAAGEPGTYLYRAVLGHHVLNRRVSNEREQVSGALIVDPPGPVPADRILLISIWGSRVDSVEWRANDYRNALAINGRSWPYTERLAAATGDTVRLRVINSSGRTHPMHLHGFYFRVHARGDGVSDTLYQADGEREAVTEVMAPFSTMALSFVPDRPGNWLFHCHVGFHVIPEARLNRSASSHHDAMAHDANVHMAGLVVGIAVRPGPGWTEPTAGERRRMHLFVQEGPPRHRSPRAMGFVLQEGASPPRPDSTVLPGSVLVLTRGQATDIVVTNRLREPTAIHWHGIELESFSDGVAGYSGMGNTLAPSIMPGDSFVAHLTLPRAGTFMYHTHLNDFEQITSGLYGAIVVVEPGHRFDPTRDHVFTVGWDGGSATVVNGDTLPAPLELAAGVPQRFRFINIGVANNAVFILRRDSAVVRWQRAAKDGAELPRHQAGMVTARQAVQVGETFDFLFTPEAGEYRLSVGPPASPFYVQRLLVR